MKFPKETRQRIYEAWLAGTTQVQLAKDYHTSQPYIARLLEEERSAEKQALLLRLFDEIAQIAQKKVDFDILSVVCRAHEALGKINGGGR